MRLGAIVLRLRSADTYFQNRIGGVADFILTDPEQEQSEVAYVIPDASAVTANTSDNNVVQSLTDNFLIVTVLNMDRYPLDRVGFDAYDQIDGIREEFFKALLGWIMPDYDWPVAYVGDQLFKINRSWLWWQFSFSITRTITSELLDTSGLDDFEKLWTQYIVHPERLPITDPLPIVDPDFESNIETE